VPVQVMAGVKTVRHDMREVAERQLEFGRD
jgi:hypothetical protein